MWVLKVKVNSWPWPKVIYIWKLKLAFLRNDWAILNQILLCAYTWPKFRWAFHRTIGPLVYYYYYFFFLFFFFFGGGGGVDDSTRLRSSARFTKIFNLTELLCPPNRRGGGHIVFGADPGVGVGVGVGVSVCDRVASFPRVIFWTDGQILTKLAQIHCWEGGTSWLDFGDLGPIFKVTATFFNVWNFVSVRYLMNQ